MKRKKQQLILYMLAMVLIFTGVIPSMALMTDYEKDYIEVMIAEALVGYENKYVASYDKEKDIFVVTTSATDANLINQKLRAYGVNIKQVKVETLSASKPNGGLSGESRSESIIAKKISLNECSIVVAKTKVNVRSGPGTKYKILGQLKGGDSVLRFESNGGWDLVEWNDGVGYVNSSYLSELTPETSGQFFAISGAQLRSSQNSRFDVVTTCPDGEWLQNVVLRKDGWLERSFTVEGLTDKVVGYIPPSHFTTIPVGFVQASGIRYVKNAMAMVHTNIGAKDTKVTDILDQGNRVRLVATKGDWALVEYINVNFASLKFNYYGYIKKADLATSPAVSSSPMALYVKDLSFETGSMLNAYSGPGTEYSVTMQVRPRNTVMRTGKVSGDWIEITNLDGTKKGYIQSKLLSDTPIW